MILYILSKMLLRDQSNSLELVELVQIFSTIYILEGVDKDKAVGKKSLLLSSSGPGPGPRSGPGKVQGLRAKDLDLG